MDEAAGIDQEELEAQDPEELSAREVMSVISPMPADDVGILQGFAQHREPLPPAEEL